MKWETKKLNEIGFVGRGKSRHRPRDASHLYGGEYPFIQTADVKHSDLYLSSYSKTYSEAGLAQSKLWNKGTLCITIAANIADTAILGIDACFPDSVLGFNADESKCDVRFIKYQFDILQQKYKQFSQGAAQDNLSLEKLLTVPLLVPPLPIQRKIASILCAYDDLIENNLRRIVLLEETARLLYQEWFVRFQFPGYEHARIVDGVPVGWKKKNLGEIVTLNYGKALTADDRVEGPYPVYGSSGIVGTNIKPLTDGPAIIIGRKGNVGSVFWSPVNFFPIDTVYYINALECSYYLFLNLKTRTFLSSDAAVPGLNRNYAYSFPMLVPSRKILREFDIVISPVFMQMFHLKAYNEKLKQARDLLLPKLMSGEVMV